MSFLCFLGIHQWFNEGVAVGMSKPGKPPYFYRCSRCGIKAVELLPMTKQDRKIEEQS